jgi:catechol 2,3-dioxygenase-like lactoylglutathione lyase family enzyme
MDRITALDHLQVTCPPGGEDEARAYWNGLLGLEEVDKPDALRSRGGCWFRVGEGARSIGLHVGVLDPFVPATKAHPALRVRSLEALAEFAGTLAEAGYPVEWAEEPIADARLKTRDPFGNLVELLVGTTG